MILIEKIVIEEFRGIRNLSLTLNGENFAVCGPNGTGKSGVVDAIEFALSGKISRLSGEGTGDISVKDHAPHVDSRSDPEKAKVTLTINIPSLKKQVVIERNVKDSLAPKITPSTPDVLEVLQQIESHPEFVLSRRELIAYVLTKPGDRSKDVQTLLQLDQIGNLRSTLLKIFNKCDSERKTQERAKKETGSQLALGLEIPELKTKNLLAAVNIRRTTLGLTSITTFTNTTSLRDGLETGAKSTAVLSVDKVQVAADIKTVQDSLLSLASPEIVEECTNLHAEITELNKDPVAKEYISRGDFLRKAVQLITENNCPVCGTEWEIDVLRPLVEAKVERFDEIAELRVGFEKRLEPIIDILESLDSGLKKLGKCTKVVSSEQVIHFSEYRKSLASKIKSLRDVVPFSDAINSLCSLVAVPSGVSAGVEIAEKIVGAIPDSSQKDAARDYLVRCHERLKAHRKTSREAKKAETCTNLAKTVYETYVKESTSELDSVYQDVQEEFSEFYRFINKDDESGFTARLIPSMGKLGFNVDFYGRGHFPPGAYHSEGHQDGMGLCLYLALMKKLHDNNFTFAILDDVLMSVDTKHRREVCKLLEKKFPDTQFVLTTHDATWLRHMRSAGLIGHSSCTHFDNWTPEQGPTEWHNRDVWGEISSALGQSDVLSASAALRNYLEYISQEICDNLGAPVRFRGDGQHSLGDTLPPAVGQLRNIFSKGEKAANSWGKIAEAEAIRERDKELAGAFRVSEADQWQVNSAIHYNEWANLTSADFAPVAEAFHNLIQKFFCEEPKCAGLLYLAKTSPPDALRCTCGAVNINLKKLSAAKKV